MRTPHILMSLACLTLFACEAEKPARSPAPADKPAASKPQPAKPAAAASVSFPCLNPPKVEATIPSDTVISDQVSLDCFAWQQFIGLNWLADTSQPPSSFGRPGDTGDVVWETYMDKENLLPDDGSAPPPWGSPDQLPAGASGKVSGPIHLMGDISKVDPEIKQAQQVAFVGMGDTRQAFPSSGPSWLADTGGNLVWYEVVVNKDEYDYFVTTGYYNAEKQASALAAGEHINLPKGALKGGVGAIELKAAWLTVPDPSAARWQRYKLSVATFCDEQNRCSQSTVALVGLHIIHKTEAQPSWIWSTFEHVDNAPDKQQVASGQSIGPYNFYNASCTANPPPPPPAGCLPQGQSWDPCKPNTPPAYDLTLSGGQPVGNCPPYPIQVVREFALPDTSENPVVSVNRASQALIAAANPDSVWQYYQLVNVLWNDSPVDENAPGTTPPKAPLSSTGFRPDPNAFPVANTTLETYIQSATCIACHSFATSAPTSADPHPPWASDYSFLFGLAGPQPGD